MSVILFVPVLAILVASGSLVRLRQSYVTQTHILQHFATVSHFSSLRLAHAIHVTISGFGIAGRGRDESHSHSCCLQPYR